jgi:membrane protease YdiL (CAAX protease family)
MPTFITQRKLGIYLVFLLLMVIFTLQLISLIEQTTLDFALLYSPVLGYFGYFYITLVYCAFSILIRLESNYLEEFHIDRFTLASLVLSSIVRSRLRIPAEGFFLILIGLAGIFMISTLILKKPTIPKTNRRWVLVGAGISSGVIILITLFELFFRNAWEIAPLFKDNEALTITRHIVAEFSFGAVIEEILFRGFLWGYLKRAGWHENRIFWMQGTLFWFLHLSKIFTPFTFFIIIPIIAMICSKLTLKSGQLYPAIIAHMIINILSAMLNLASY